MKGPFSIVLLVALGFVGVSWVGAQDPAKEAAPKAQEVQVPQKKVDGAVAPSPFPSGYFDYPALTDALGRVAVAHPDLVKVESLARSKEGRDVWIASIGAAAKDAPAKPSILLVANLEADHVVGSQVALGLVEKLAGVGPEDVQKGGRSTSIPRLNPDGR